MRITIAAILLTALTAAGSPQYRTLNDRFEPPRFTSLDAWNARAAYIREHILASAGLLPMPRREDLKPVISGEIRHPDYIVSKVAFESLPGFLVTGNLYRPIGDGPFPAILSPHGHWSHGRLENTDVTSIPGRAIGLARQGFVVFTHDMIGYADSRQLTHNFGGSREALWGLSLGGLQLWNGIRALDFLETLPYVRKDGIGATGESGGGTQTFLLAAVDQRIKVAAPVNMISLHMQGGCLCENMPNLRLDITNVDIAATIAPRPLLMVSATGDWTNETLENEYPAVRSIYSLLGAEKNVHAVRVDAPHNYNKESREAVYAWMARWLQHAPADVKIAEKPFTVDPPESLLLVPPGGKLPDRALPEDAIVRRWMTVARWRVAERGTVSSIDPELDAAFRHALGFGAESTVPAPPPSGGPRVAIVGGVSEDVSRQLKAAGFDVRSVPAAVIREPAEIKHFATYNRTTASQRVADLVAALRAAPSAVLVAEGESALPALLAAAIVPVRRAVIDVGRFNLSNDDEFVRRVFIPGLRRAGDFETAIDLAQGELVVHNAGDGFDVSGLKAIKRKLLPREVVARAAAPARAAWRHVVRAECGVAFDVPPSWLMTKGAPEPGADPGDCDVDLSPPDWARKAAASEYETDTTAIHVGVSAGKLDDDACEKGLVCRDGDNWYFEGRAGARSDVWHVPLPAGDLFIGRVETGAYRKGGGYAGASDARSALLYSNGRFVDITADRGFDDERAFARLVRSIRFLKPQSPRQ